MLGSYSSALETALVPLNPPEKSTFPLGRSVGSRPHAHDMLPLTENVRVEGSYNSVLARTPEVFWPPAIKTFPLFSTVAVCA